MGYRIHNTRALLKQVLAGRASIADLKATTGRQQRVFIYKPGEMEKHREIALQSGIAGVYFLLPDNGR